MALKDYTPETSEIEFKGGSFHVKGLSLDTISTLVRTHLPDLDKLIGLVHSQLSPDGSFGSNEATGIAIKLATDAPSLVANIIALASDSPGADGVAAASKLGFALQIQTLTTIGRLTFEEVGGVKKFLTWLMQVIGTNLPRETQQQIMAKAQQYVTTTH